MPLEASNKGGQEPACLLASGCDWDDSWRTNGETGITLARTEAIEMTETYGVDGSGGADIRTNIRG